MKSFKLILIITAIALFVMTCTETEVPTKNVASVIPSNTNALSATTDSFVNTEFAAAKLIYDKKCVKCHLETGEGGKVQIDTVSLKVPNFRDPRNQDDDDNDYIEKVEKGATGKMPAFKGKLTDDEIIAIVGYIRHQFQGK